MTGCAGTTTGIGGIADDWIRHEDAALIALRKPAGLLTVPGRGTDKADCLATRAARRWPDALVVHRLDQATSGLVLMARGTDMQRALSRLFEERQVIKLYEAIVHGCPQDASNGSAWHDLSLPIARDWPNRPRSKIDRQQGKPSHTRWLRICCNTDANTCRLLLQPITGRSHQLRVHLHAMAHPVVGDTLYGPPDAAPRMMLHASRLQLIHPATGQELLLDDAPDF